MIHTIARSTATNCEHLQVLCVMFGKGWEMAWNLRIGREMQRAAESAWTKSDQSQMSTWRIEVMEVFFTAKHLSWNPPNASMRLFAERSVDSFCKMFWSRCTLSRALSAREILSISRELSKCRAVCMKSADLWHRISVRMSWGGGGY